MDAFGSIFCYFCNGYFSRHTKVIFWWNFAYVGVLAQLVFGKQIFPAPTTFSLLGVRRHMRLVIVTDIVLYFQCCPACDIGYQLGLLSRAIPAVSVLICWIKFR